MIIITNILLIIEEKLESLKNSNELININSSTYNVANAKAYARSWWNNFNMYYNYYPDAECTNFVSQILFAGGMPMNFDTTNGWYAYSSYNSRSWSLVPEFYTYWSKLKSTRTSTSKATIVINSKEGDVVQFRKDGATRWGHSESFSYYIYLVF